MTTRWSPVATDARPPICTMLDGGKPHGEMRFIQGRNGPFWGCTRYPKCRHTVDAQAHDAAEASRLGYGNDDEMVRWDR